ncbi:MAG: peptidylprolyl isomerase [Hyphomonadaceae bacterium]
MKALAAAAALAALSAGAMAIPAYAQMSEGVAAIVNDDIISTYDVRQRALLILASNGVQPTQENQQRARAQALRDLVDERLQIQEARQFEIRITADAIDNTLAGIARQNNMTADQFVSQLNASGINPMTLRRQIEADTAWRRLMNGLYGSRVRISDARVRDMQARIIESATRTQYQSSEIFLPASNPAEFAEAEAAATRLIAEMQAGAPFPLVARQFSAAPSAAAGGDLGWLSAGEMRPEVQAVLDTMQQGQVSPPIRVNDGIVIAALRARRDGSSEAAVQRVALQQVSAPAASRNALDRARARITNCENLANQFRSVDGAEVTDLGVVSESDLSPEIRAVVDTLEANQASTPAINGERATSLIVCRRDVSVEGLPSTTDIENRLFEQEMALLAQRYLRNLRREATIITR